MKNTILKKLGMALAIGCVLAVGFNASALSISNSDPRYLGLIDPNHPADPTSSEDFIDILLDQAVGSGPTTIGANSYTRSNNDPLGGVYADAVYAGVEFGENVTSIDLGAGGYLYLLAKYDGPNFGSAIWYVGGLSGIVNIPLNGQGNKYAVSHSSLFNGTTPPPPTTTRVPDGGTTVMLLGMALAGLGAVRRYLA